MADDRMQPNLKEQPEQTKPEREAQPAQQSPSDLGGSVGPARGVGTEATLPQLKEHAVEATMKPGIRRRAPARDQVEAATARYGAAMERHKPSISPAW
jgi:hypothetical protein